VDDFTTRLANQELEGRYAKMIQGAMDAGNSALAQKLSEQIEIIRRGNTEQQAVEEANYQERISTLNGFAEQVKSIISGVSGATKIDLEIDMHPNKVAKDATTVTKSMDNMGKNIKSIVEKGIIASIMSMGKAFAQNDDLASAFIATILNVFGDLQIQLGIAATGIGALADAIRASIVGLAGGQAIVAGVAAIAMGAALKAYAAKMGAASSGGSSASPMSSGAETAYTTAPEEETLAKTEEPQSSVVVNIQGDVLDSDESGLRIVDIINKAVEGQNVKITQRAFA